MKKELWSFSIGVLALGAFMVVVLPFGLRQEIKPFSKTEIMMDTVISMTVYGEEKVVEKGMARAFSAMKKVEEMASFHLVDSELHRLNTVRTLTPSPEFAALFRAASETVSLSRGYFDPTFSVLQRAYGFYDGQGRLPAADELAACLAVVGWNRVVRETGSGSSLLFSLADGAQLDFGGIAGGYSMEAAIRELRAASCAAFLVDDAGDLWMEGEKPDGKPWRIGVKDPRQEGGFLAIFESREPVAISTSGNYERFVTVAGKRYCHIMDPFTGKPAEYYDSVTAVASCPLLADTLSTALFCMAPEQAQAFALETGVAVLYLTSTGRIWVSPAGHKWFKDIRP
jgi:thiamine biosynthesis lipoprotein